MTDVFGTMPDGKAVHRLRLEGGGMTAHVLTYGAILQDLRLAGHDAPLVLGFPEFDPYLTHSPYFGATAGRCANRIRDGHLELEGTTFQLDRNFIGKHSLHGGAHGTGKQLWTIEVHTRDRATLSVSLPDGDMGFPGNLTARVHFRLLDEGVLDIRMEAQSDAVTLCNFAHHSYFNLDGGPTISNHQLQVAADHYLPVDDELIPTGEILAVAGTQFDFRTAAPVSKAKLLDHNFCLSSARSELRPVAWLTSSVSGVSMECLTTEPGLQIYDGANVDVDLPGLTGGSISACSGIAMEPQVWPDANHHNHFPQAVLRPDETYSQNTQYKFSRGIS